MKSLSVSKDKMTEDAWDAINEMKKLFYAQEKIRLTNADAVVRILENFLKDVK
jgi:hypothetical protein